jgi:allantoate deiminase
MNTGFSQRDLEALGARAEAMIEALAKISAEPNRLVRRFLSPEHRRAADLTATWMRAAGLEVSEDALGTVRGRWQSGARGSAKRLLIGSHLDTVIDAGKYDGPLGVIAGILAAEHFVRAGRPPPFGIDVLAFGDEEGSRFPATFASSLACAAAFDTATLALADGDGVTLAQALSAYGKDARDIPSAAYAREEAAAYVEVHIEQGPLLEAEGVPLGVVTGIIGQSRLRVLVTGEAGHAGTVPMTFRHDALLGAAEMALAAERVARENQGMVATVGQIEARPGAVNIIPGRVVFTLDLRAMHDADVDAGVAQFEQEARSIAAARGVTVNVERYYDTHGIACAPHLQVGLAAAIKKLGQRPVHLASGAGHDAQMMAKLCPSAMLFVRCRGGISHNPAEYASPADMGLAVAALIHFIAWLGQR